MKSTTKIASLMAILGVACFVAPVYPGGQLNAVNGGGILTGEHWELGSALSNRTPGDGRTLEVYFAQGTAAARIASIQNAHASWEGVVAVDFDDVGNTLPHAPSNGAGGGTPDGYNTHSFEFTLGCGGILGVTPTVTNATTGRIVELDVFYEGNACVNYSTDGTPTAQQFELEAVAVHEMGHGIGLSHSGEVDSTMFPSIPPGTTAVVSLEPDDNSSVTNVYGQDSGDVNVPTGGISGRIIDGNDSNDGKVCALVYAFDSDEAPITLFSQAYVQVYSGSVIGDSAANNTSGLTSGYYEINGLPDGDWFVLVDPIGNVVQPGQISDWCAANSETDVTQEWWNGVAESNAEGCTSCVVPVTVSGGQVTTGIDIYTETGTCNTTETPEVSCADGVDNDCDGFGDCDDGDCAGDPACTGGCTNPSECTDNNVCNGIEDCVAGSCVSGTPLNCDDGLFCNGAETCDPVLGCQAGTAPNCDDGVGCTDDSCNEGTDSCDNIANNANCPDDGLFCNGTEFCDAALDCSSTGDPCTGGETCNEATDTCDLPVCDNDGTCESGEDCNNCPNDCFSGSGASCGNGVCEAGDGEDCVSCPGDCNGVQSGKPSNRYCCGDGDGQNPVGCGDSRCTGGGNTCTDVPAVPSCCGDSTCEGTEDAGNCAIDCATGCTIPADCNDGVGCTDDDCVGGACVNTPNDANCPDDGQFCNGTEFCDAVIDCSSTGDPCGGGTTCNETTDTCDGCGVNKDPCTTNADCCSNNCKNGSCKGN